MDSLHRSVVHASALIYVCEMSNCHELRTVLQLMTELFSQLNNTSIQSFNNVHPSSYLIATVAQGNIILAASARLLTTHAGNVLIQYCTEDT